MNYLNENYLNKKINNSEMELFKRKKNNYLNKKRNNYSIKSIKGRCTQANLPVSC